MKPFNLKEAKQGKPVVTRDGRDVRILAFDLKKYGCKQIVGLVDDGDQEILAAFYDGGAYRCGLPSEFDLFMKSEKKEGWINLYSGYGEQNVRRVGGIFDTEHEALKAGNDLFNYITTIKVEWEE